VKAKHAAANAGGYAGRVYQAIEGLRWQAAEDDLVMVFDGDGFHRKLRWVELDVTTGELVVIAGTLRDMQRIRLDDAQALEAANTSADLIAAQSTLGKIVRIYRRPRFVPRTAHAQPGEVAGVGVEAD
jgi:hypothetical protein